MLDLVVTRNNGNGIQSSAECSDPFDQHAIETSHRGAAYATAALQNVAAELAATEEGERNYKLYQCAFRMGTMVARSWIERHTVARELLAAADVCGLVKDDGSHTARATNRSGLNGGLKHPHADLVEQTVQASTAPLKLLQSSAEFVANFMPPDYLVDGLLQRRYVYSLTAPTGSGKTAIVLLLAAHVARGKPLAGCDV